MKKLDEGMVRQIVDGEGLAILKHNERLEILYENREEARKDLNIALVEIKVVEEERDARINRILNMMTPANIKRVVTDEVIVAREQNVNPTITADNLDDVPHEFVVPRPTLDKRWIQSYISKTGKVPAGINVEYKQRLKVLRRYTRKASRS